MQAQTGRCWGRGPGRGREAHVWAACLTDWAKEAKLLNGLGGVPLDAGSPVR